MIKLKLHAEWMDEKSIREVYNKYTKGNYTWNNLYLTLDDDYDYLVVMNYPKCNFDPRKTVLFIHEPANIRQTWPQWYINPNSNSYLKIYPMPMVWYEHYLKDYNFLQNNSPEKTKDMSAIVSGMQKAHFEGGVQRYNFLPYLDKLTNCDIFGKGQYGFNLKNYKGSVKGKEEALLPYKYTFAGENSYERHYRTEKIIDPIISECLCFYSGCPNIDDYIDPRALIKVDLSKPDEAIKLIQKAILDNEWEKRIQYIREEKYKILNEKQIFPQLEKDIKNGII